MLSKYTDDPRMVAVVSGADHSHFIFFISIHVAAEILVAYVCIALLRRSTHSYKFWQ
jgi:hypothetical protein